MHQHPANVAPCHHIFPDTHRCGSPALRGETFCYFHHPRRKPSANSRAHRGFTLPPPTSRQNIYRALTEVIARLAANQLDVHRAGLLLYSLQIAAQALPHNTHNA
jgi:hypothetical protein